MKARLVLFRSQLPRKVREQSIAARRAIAHEIVAEASSAAPRLTGVYSDSMVVRQEGTQILAANDDVLAIHKEYGTSKMGGIAALTQAAIRHGKYSGMRPRRGRRIAK